MLRLLAQRFTLLVVRSSLLNRYIAYHAAANLCFKAVRLSLHFPARLQSTNMVSYTEVRDSNSRILTSLPAGLVAVFVGGTNGIGEYTLKQVARHTKFPRVYFVGRSQEAGDRIRAECEQLNPDGSFTFIRGDAGLIKNVDELCRDIKAKEKSINLLFLSIGTLDFYSSK